MSQEIFFCLLITISQQFLLKKKKKLLFCNSIPALGTFDNVDCKAISTANYSYEKLVGYSKFQTSISYFEAS